MEAAREGEAAVTTDVRGGMDCIPPVYLLPDGRALEVRRDGLGWYIQDRNGIVTSSPDAERIRAYLRARKALQQ